MQVRGGDPFQGYTEAGGPPPFCRQVEDVLLLAEAEIALIASLTPTNFVEESAKLLDSCLAGAPQRPNFSYVPRSLQTQKGDRARHLLSRAREVLDGAERKHPVGELLRDRLLELELEVELLAACGTDRVGDLSALRFPFEPKLLQNAAELAEIWLGEKDQEGSATGGLSSLAGHLLARARTESATLGVSILIVEADIASLAAIGGECLYVRRGARVTEAEAARVFSHEVHGHLLPRLLSKREGPPFRIGTRGWSEDEEGRAILLEERIGALSAARKREIAVRFVLARAVRDGLGSAERAAKELLSAGSPAPLIATTLARVFRGGGLAREIIYLPGYLRVREFLSRVPFAERLMERGRISVEGAHLLSSI